MPLFVTPLALAALAALPTLAAIYWLRNRYRKQAVSSLLLWVDPRQPREGGMRLQRVQTPLLFFLELLALALLAMGAADPHLPLRNVNRPVVVVLDDSYSMRADEPDSPRSRAEAALIEELNDLAPFTATLVLAGAEPGVLGQRLTKVSEVREALAGWQCQAASASLDRAVALATELGGPRAKVLVLSDGPPAEKTNPGDPEEAKSSGGLLPGAGVLRWLAFGQPIANVALVNATRSISDVGDKALLEVANLSGQATTATLTVDGQPRRLELAPRASRRLWLDLGTERRPLRVTLADDALAIDNTVELLPPMVRPVNVAWQVNDATLRALLTEALQATGQTTSSLPGTSTSQEAKLLITDSPLPPATRPEAWRLRVLAEKEASAYVGPFVLDRAHPLTDGLSLAGVVWGGGSSEMAGRPVVMAGNTPLLSVVDRPDGGRDVLLRLRTDLSTLSASPTLPVLMWNLARWRQVHLPGPTEVNLRLGAQTTLSPPPGTQALRVTSPDGRVRELPATGGPVTLHGETAGRYRIEALPADPDLPAQSLDVDEEYELAVNALSQDESDLRQRVTGQWGTWLDEEALRREHQSVAWTLLLAALGVLVLHALLMSSRRGSGI